MSRKHQAKLIDIQRAIEVHKPFAAVPGIEIEIILPEPRPDPKVYKGRDHRALIQCKTTGKYLVTAKSAKALLAKIVDGWKFDPNEGEGLWT